MTGAWIAIGLLLVGLPVLAWWVGGRRVWNRLTPGAEPDLFREMVRRHALRPAEIAQVEHAVTWGRELTDPRLRAAVVEWARAGQQPRGPRAPLRPRARRVVGTLALLWALVAAGTLVVAAVHGEWDRILHLLIYALVPGAAAGVAARGPRRAVRLNSGPPGGSADPAQRE